jgi:hypothetical protein
VQTGTPRHIGINESVEQINQKDRIGKTTLIYENRDYPNFSAINELIPQNCFVGLHEMIPGLENNFYPAPRKSVVQPLSPAKLQTLPKQTIYLHNLGIATSKLFD